MIADGALTLWRRSQGGFGRRIVRPARLEPGSQAVFGAVQPTADGGASAGVKAWLPGGADVAPGDYCAAGDVAGDEPPEQCWRVVSVTPWTLSGRPHHVEVVAR